MADIPIPRPTRFPWRFALYAVVVLYLIGDLYWFGGPLRKRVDEQRAFTSYSLDRALEEGWVATVNQEPITRGQLDQATAVYLFRRGKTAADLSPGGLRISQRAALQELIDDTIVRKYAAADAFEAEPDAVETAIASFESQFASREEQDARMAALGLDRPRLHELIAEQVRQRDWIEWRIAEATTVTEADLREWWRQNGSIDPGGKNPKLVRARHLFLSTVQEDTPERERQIKEWHRLITAGEAEFEDLVAAFSEDERTKKVGGDLGWFGRGRMPEDFAEVVFGLEVGQLSEPFRSALGWHVAEVTDTRDSTRLDYDTLKPEIAAWLRTERRRYAIEVLMNRLTTVAVVEVFPDNFGNVAAGGKE